MQIRSFSPDDVDALRAVFQSSVHELGRSFYTPEQLQAWAPQPDDRQAWALRLAANQPFVAVLNGQVAGFADLQASGYVDQFFVSGAFAGRGVAARLMQHILERARQQGLRRVFANVSLAAEGLFAKYGFQVVARQTVTVRGVALHNARMEKLLTGDPPS
ncbi:MAG: GNAT family N-acetyltransferase [Burkholderiaceae bacterium]